MDSILLSQLIYTLGEVKTDCEITLVTSDSRAVEQNSVFLAIKGERVNGQDYASQAVKNGARLVISEDFIPDVPTDLLLIVANILDASIVMGKNFRDKYPLQTIGITGSVGKTTTKDFVYTALSPFAKTVRSMGNQNNELGMPQTIYGFKDDDKFAILEMGMANFNDVHKLSLAARPHGAIITCIGVSHLQQMKTQENILKAKLEICDGMDEDGILVLNGDDKFLSKVNVDKPRNVYWFAIENQGADVVAKGIKQDNFSTHFDIWD
ncbi:MAG: UDP-N-acetylmuramoyl-tripeptide--D-alanyl-D-alanine ligase, partial [Oscillospiraceae bacterium]